MSPNTKHEGPPLSRYVRYLWTGGVTMKVQFVLDDHWCCNIVFKWTSAGMQVRFQKKSESEIPDCRRVLAAVVGFKPTDCH